MPKDDHPLRAPTGDENKSRLARLRDRHDPLTSLVLTVPVFLVYHLGILFIDLRNGVDLVSGLTFRLLEQSIGAYVAVTVGGAMALVGAGVFLRRGDKRFQPRELVPVLVESAVRGLYVAHRRLGHRAHLLSRSFRGSPAALGNLENAMHFHRLPSLRGNRGPSRYSLP
ncbi:MAG: hypothetical protein JRH11_18735 [Deltaproteobacteria bacterium]|nr:hypothetical protein [Deltaproteobacteria bacterium]